MLRGTNLHLAQHAAARRGVDTLSKPPSPFAGRPGTAQSLMRLGKYVTITGKKMIAIKQMVNAI